MKRLTRTKMANTNQDFQLRFSVISLMRFMILSFLPLLRIADNDHASAAPPSVARWRRLDARVKAAATQGNRS
jgi:hypothetical protein